MNDCLNGMSVLASTSDSEIDFIVIVNKGDFNAAVSIIELERRLFFDGDEESGFDLLTDCISSALEDAGIGFMMPDFYEITGG